MQIAMCGRTWPPETGRDIAFPFKGHSVPLFFTSTKTLLITKKEINSHQYIKFVHRAFSLNPDNP